MSLYICWQKLLGDIFHFNELCKYIYPLAEAARRYVNGIEYDLCISVGKGCQEVNHLYLHVPGNGQEVHHYELLAGVARR